MGTPKLKELEVPAPGPNQEEFYEKDIGMGDKVEGISGGVIPPTGDYVDDDVSKPDGPLFDGPQSWPSDKLHGEDGGGLK